MADKIRLLPEVVANQIAAGEVVNRPASVVKEMMENAIDAGARCVKVNFRDGGKELIQIVDDGCGMSAIDARMAFDRHATSKIRSAEDIYSLHTFGFRGEALASIAAVAQVELRTRQADDEMGTEVEIHGGQFIGQKAVMCPVGSQFFVRNLFYNVPARRRFLEKSTASAKQIKCEFQRVALCYPEVEFELYANDALQYQLPASTLAGRIVDLVGRSIKQNLLEVEASTSIASVRGFIGRPSAAKQRNTEQFLFVNGRYFKSPYLVSALLKGYDKLIPQTAQPSYFLFLEIDPSRIDVNIHPQKTEVKFADEEAVWQILNAAVRETLAKSGAVPMMDFDRTTDVEIPVQRQGVMYSEPRSTMRENYNPFSDSYIDPSAPDPNSDFQGFDVPYRDPAGVVSDVSSYPSSGRQSSFRPMMLEPNEEFDDFCSGGCIAEESSTEEESFIDFTSSSAQDASSTLDLPSTRPIFSTPMVLGGGYVGAMMEGRFMIVDARRARERILDEEYLRRLTTTTSVSQQLLFPEQLLFSEEEYRLLEEQEVALASLGFDLHFMGEGAVEVHGLPSDVAVEELERVLYELLQTCAEPIALEQVRRERMALIMARHGAVAALRLSSGEEAEALLVQLAATENYSFSPSGKRIMAEFSTEDMRSKLG